MGRRAGDLFISHLFLTTYVDNVAERESAHLLSTPVFGFLVTHSADGTYPRLVINQVELYAVYRKLTLAQLLRYTSVSS